VIGLVLIAAALPGAVAAQGSESLAGTWKLNLAKSKYSPGPPPRSNTVIYEAVGQDLRARAEGIDPQGNPTKVDFGVLSVDGKSNPIIGSPAYDAASSKQVNPSTIESTRTKAGRAVQTTTQVFSANGKSFTFTFTVTGVDERGQQINNVSVWEKQ